MLFTAVSSISLSYSTNTSIHTGTGIQAERTSTNTNVSTATLINTCTHSYASSHTKWHQSIENRHSSCQTTAYFFSSLQLSLYCTCLKFQALTLSVPSRLIFNAVHTGECLFQGCTYLYIHKSKYRQHEFTLCAHINTAGYHEKSCKPTYAQIRETQAHIDTNQACVK